jgi:prepilin-type N-terminal cleavage/methylation domain-containing protein
MNRAGTRQYGYTLVEVLVTLAIVSIVAGLVVTIAYQLLRIPSWGNAQLAVDSDLRNAGLWLTRDGNESLTFSGTAGTCTPFTFDTGPERGVVYTYTLDADTLWREASGSGTVTGVARNVGSVQCPAGQTTNMVGITVIAISGEVSARETYTVAMRVE